MKKTFSQQELKQKADEVFEQYPTAQQLYATVDGNIFLMKNRAELHSLKDKVYIFDRPLVVEAKKAKEKDNKDQGDKKLTKALDIIAFIEKAEKLDDIKVYADDTRSTVKAAYDAKAEALVKNIEVKK